MMARFKVVISDPESGTTKNAEIEEDLAAPMIGKKVGETLDGTIVGLPGHRIQITGGSDKDGFPIRPSVHGGVRRRVILSGGVGFNPEGRGQRRRKTVRGNVITDDIVQINMKILEKPKQTEEEKRKKGKPSEAESETPQPKASSENKKT